MIDVDCETKWQCQKQFTLLRLQLQYLQHYFWSCVYDL